MFELKIKGEKETIYLDDKQGEKIRVAWLHHKHDGDDGVVSFKADSREYNIELSQIKSITKVVENEKSKKFNKSIKKINQDYIKYRIDKLKNGRSTKFFELLYYAMTGEDTSLDLIIQAQTIQDEFFKEKEKQNEYRILPDVDIFDDLIKINNTKPKSINMLHIHEAARPELLRLLEMQLITDIQYSKYTVQNLENMLK